MSVCYKCCVLLVRGLCDELISRLEESNRRWWVAVCDLEALIMRRAWPNGCFAPEKNNIFNIQTARQAEGNNKPN